MAMVFVGLWLLGNASVASAAEASKEAQLKAAFVFNFVRYTEWPASSFASTSAPVRLCAFSLSSDIGLALSGLANNRVGERLLEVRQVASQDDLSECHLAYFEEGAGARSKSLVMGATTPLLTIGEASEFARHGGVIGLVSRGKRLAFEVNLDAAKRAQLRLSSQLLALAQIVKDG